MKLMIWVGIIVGSTVGGLLGAKFDSGLGLWSVLFSTVGGLAGVWAGFRIGKMYF